MGRAPCCEKIGLKKGPWTAEEDKKLIQYIQTNGHGNWRTLPKNAGLLRCGKSCRLRWTNYLRPDIRRGSFSSQEEDTIIQLHTILGNKWSAIAARLPGRTDNEIKNYWNTKIRKRLLRMGIDPITHTFRLDHLLGLSTTILNSKFSRMHHHDQLPLLINHETMMRSLASSTLPYNSHTQNPNHYDNPHHQPPLTQTCQMKSPFQDLTITHHDHDLMHFHHVENFSQNLSGFGSSENCKINDEWQQTDVYVPLENYGYYGSGQLVVDPTPSILD